MGLRINGSYRDTSAATALPREIRRGDLDAGQIRGDDVLDRLILALAMRKRGFHEAHCCFVASATVYPL